MTKLSAVVISKKDEKKLPGCLTSLKWADETVLVDTTNLAGGFSEWRNAGFKRAKGDWLLYVDSDERVTPELKAEILAVIKESKFNKSAYAIPRKNYIFGKEFKHGGQWPDYVKRLFFKNNLKSWQGELHEEPEFEGEMGHLKSPLIHIKHDTLSEMVEKTNIWSEIEGKLMYDAGHPPMTALRFFSALAREFWLRMVRQMAFLDGPEGIIYALYQVFSRGVSYAKLWEMQLTEK